MLAVPCGGVFGGGARPVSVFGVPGGGVAAIFGIGVAPIFGTGVAAIFGSAPAVPDATTYGPLRRGVSGSGGRGSTSSASDGGRVFAATSVASRAWQLASSGATSRMLLHTAI